MAQAELQSAGSVHRMSIKLLRCLPMQWGTVRGSKRRRGDSWQLRVLVGKDPVTGTPRYLAETVHGTERQAERRLAELVRSHRGAGPISTAKTVGELVDAWWEITEGDLSPSTARNTRWIILAKIKPWLGDVALDRLGTADLDRFYRRLMKEGGKGGRPMAPASVRRVHDVIRSALGQGVRWGWLVVSPAEKARPPRVPVHDVRPPEPAQVVALLREAEGVNPGLPLFFRLAATTGARRSELIALRWSDLDLDRRRMTIARGIVEDWHANLVEKDTKTHSTRRLALDPVTVELLVEHRRRGERLAGECGVALVADGFVFSHDAASREPWRPDYATHAFRALTRRLGMDGLRLHDLRHYVATRLLANGTDVRTVAGRLGHRNASTTLNVYAHFVPAADEDAAGVLGDLLVEELSERILGHDDAPAETDGA